MPNVEGNQPTFQPGCPVRCQPPSASGAIAVEHPSYGPGQAGQHRHRRLEVLLALFGDGNLRPANCQPPGAPALGGRDKRSRQTTLISAQGRDRGCRGAGGGKPVVIRSSLGGGVPRRCPIPGGSIQPTPCRGLLSSPAPSRPPQAAQLRLTSVSGSSVGHLGTITQTIPVGGVARRRARRQRGVSEPNCAVMDEMSIMRRDQDELCAPARADDSETLVSQTSETATNTNRPASAGQHCGVVQAL